MPQLSLYLDEDTLKKIETGAKINKTSVSKFVSVALKEYFSGNYPEGFQNLFGSVSDDSFSAPNSLNTALDSKRESLWVFI